jgi:hypothetical protein
MKFLASLARKCSPCVSLKFQSQVRINRRIIAVVVQLDITFINGVNPDLIPS